MENNTICTRADFARLIGKTRALVTYIFKKYGDRDTIDFNSVDGKVYTVRLMRMRGTKKDLICIVSIVG